MSNMPVMAGMGPNSNNSTDSLTGGFNLTPIAGNYTAEYEFLQAMVDFSDFDPTNQYLAQVFWYTMAGQPLSKADSSLEAPKDPN
jgi:membrane protein required for beta-lactamase induction